MVRPPETFTTKRLLLRLPRVSDAKAIFCNYAQDSEATRYLVWRPYTDIRDTETFLKHCEMVWRENLEFPWAITLQENDDVIGMVGLRINDFKADVGYVIGPSWWSQGYATEAVQPVVDWALSQPTIFRVWAMVDVDNPASARVLEKVGMKREGVLRRSSLHPNVSDEPRDSYCYAIVK